jgi:hypothetical protein
VFLFAGENPGIWSLVGGVIVVAVITTWYVYDAKHPQVLDHVKPEPEAA